MTNLDKFVSMFYLSSQREFNADDVYWGEWNVKGKYYMVRQYPIDEMLSKGLIGVSEDLIEMTSSADWRVQQRRPLSCGDIICYGHDVWIVTPTKNTEGPVSDTVHILPSWPQYALIQLHNHSVKDLLCDS